MSSKVDIFEERLKAREVDKRDIFKERASLRKISPSTAKDVGKQAAIGTAKGALGTAGNLLDLIGAQATEILPGEKTHYDIQFEILEKMQQPGYKPSLAELSYLTDDDVAPRYSRVPSAKDVEQLIGMLGVDTEPQTGAGRYAGRAGEAIGSGLALGAGPGALAALGGGALAGQAVEEATDSPVAGAVTEIITSLGPAALRGRLAPVSKQAKELVKAGRKVGLSEKEITPLIQRRRKLATLGKIARKGSKTQKTFAQIENKLGDSYQTLKEAASDLPPLSLSQNEKLLTGLGQINTELRTTLKAAPDKEAAIKFVQEAMENVRNRGANPDELIGFWQDINQAVNWNAIKGGRKSLAALKKPISQALRESSPRLYEEFEQTNRLYSRFKKVSKALRPDMIDRWINKGEMGALAFGIATGNPWILKKIGGEAAARILARELLTNPKLQNISNKMLNAIKNNKGAAASRLLSSSKKILEKTHPTENWEFIEEDKL